MKPNEITLTVGDVVRLKSGGPLLTITDNRLSETALDVAWFDAEDTLQSATFAPECVYLIIISSEG